MKNTESAPPLHGGERNCGKTCNFRRIPSVAAWDRYNGKRGGSGTP